MRSIEFPGLNRPSHTWSQPARLTLRTSLFSRCVVEAQGSVFYLILIQPGKASATPALQPGKVKLLPKAIGKSDQVDIPLVWVSGSVCRA